MTYPRQPRSLRPPEDFVPFLKSEFEQTIPERFEKVVEVYPQRLAVRAGQEMLTYAELNERANRVAHTLLDRCGAGEEPVVLLFEHGAPFIVALLGVLKAGKFYAPIDPTLPRAGVAALFSDLEARAVLTDNMPAARELVPTGDGVRLIDVARLEDDLPTENPHIPISPDHYAYIIFTSGSTGSPKGALAAHVNVLRFTMNYTNRLYYSPSDRLTLLHALTGNAAEADIYFSLLNGSSIFPFSVQREGFARAAAWLREERITSYSSLPLLFRRLAGVLDGENLFPALRIIRLAGDRVLRSDVELFNRYFSPNCLLRNGFGAAEVLSITEYLMERGSAVAGPVVPVGYAAQDAEILILDEDGNPLGPGQSGEIAVRSRYLSPGYWKRPDLTAAKFIGEPGSVRTYLTGDVGRMAEDGCLFHLGRKDFRVKVRGKLIAPIEVEDALLDIDGIEEVVVVAREEGSGEQRLVAYYVAKPPGPSVSEIRRALATTLPDEMIPAIFVALEAMPLNTGNKIDRQALPAPDRRRPMLETPFVAPATPVEKALATIWASVLALDEVGTQDRFLELGGDSLLALQVAARVVERFQVEIPVQSLFAAPTVSTMATKIVAHLAKSMNGDHLL